MAKRINRPNKEAVLHFVTINVRDKVKVFSREPYAHEALLLLRQHCDAHPARLVAYVAMPEHLHGLINPRDGEIQNFLA